MTDSHDLSALNPGSFEHLVNSLAIRVLGSGVTTFGPGPDGGRDGLFVGEAPYPSTAEGWQGVWYIQSKFHAPRVSGNEQKWLLKQIKSELKLFQDTEKDRAWPDIWILATNVDPSGVPATGAYDAALTLVKKSRPELAGRFHIWGGAKILDLLDLHPEVAARYGHFLTPGHVLATLYQQLQDDRASVERIVDHLVIDAIEDSKFAKLEQTGSSADRRPGIHQLFVDLPFSALGQEWQSKAFAALSFAASENHGADPAMPGHAEWLRWRRYPTRARIWVLKGGPGQGKSTIGQYFCQVQRAALVLDSDLAIAPETLQLAAGIKETVSAHSEHAWPLSPRIPLFIELKDYAHWYGKRNEDDAKNVLSFLAARLWRAMGIRVEVATLERALAIRAWVVVFDGLDEVPSDVKDQIAGEIERFLRRAGTRGDVFAICTSRPQGYTGQLDVLNGATIELAPLPPEDALQCAERLIRIDRSQAEGDRGIAVLTEAIQSSAVGNLMRTPLQAHIMAVIVRAGQRPPEMRWRLYDRFFKVIFNRERIKEHADPMLRKIFAEDEDLLTRVHDHAGFVLHARAERSEGSAASLSRSEFRNIVQRLVDQHKDADKRVIVDSVMLAARERLVLLTTPESGGQIRYDVRQLQEFFAARFLFHDVELSELRDRLRVVAGDVHWREVMHFLMSALVDGKRRNELAVAIEVLVWLDQGEGDEAAARFCSRLGRGATIAARLLEDGVLEASKPDRNRFRECLRPCLATDDSEFLAPLGQTSTRASKQWLLELLGEHITTRQPGEALGAMWLLWRLLPEGDPGLKPLVATLAAVPGQIIGWTADHLRYQWHTSAFLAALRSEAVEAVARRLDYRIRSRLSRILGDAPRHSHEDDDLMITQWAIDADPPANADEENDFGWAKPFRFFHWHREENSSLISLAERNDPEETSGISRLYRAALRMECSSERKNLVAFLQLLPREPSWFDACYPIKVLFLLHHEVAAKDLDALLFELEAMSDEGFTRLLDRGLITSEMPAGSAWSFSSGTGTIEQFVAFAEEYPAAAVVRWQNSGTHTELFEPEALAAIVSTIRAKPRLSKFVSPLLWHHIAADNETVRKILVADCPQSDLDFPRAYIISNQMTPKFLGALPLQLPTESPVLLALGSALVGVMPRVPNFSELVKWFVDDPDSFAAIAEDEALPISERLGAVLVGMLHPGGSLEFVVAHGELLVASAKQWPNFTSLLVRGIERLGGWDTPAIRGLLSSLIAADPIEASSSADWKNLYRGFRELSRAPVTESGSIDKWLEYGTE